MWGTLCLLICDTIQQRFTLGLWLVGFGALDATFSCRGRMRSSRSGVGGEGRDLAIEAWSGGRGSGGVLGMEGRTGMCLGGVV